MFYIIQKEERSSSQVYLCDRATLALQNTAGNSIEVKCSAPTLEHLKGFIEEPHECRQVSAVGLHVHFIRMLGKVFKVGWKMVRSAIQNLQASDVGQRFSAKVLENCRVS